MLKSTEIEEEVILAKPRTWMAACCSRTERDLPAAILLHEIVRFQKISTAEFQGKRWIGFTQHEWTARTGLSKRQIARATKLLRDRGLILVKPAKRAVIGIRLNHFHVPDVIYTSIVTTQKKGSKSGYASNQSA